MSTINLKKLRGRFGLTQSAAAVLVRATPNTWARWERGEVKPTARSLRLITMLPELVPAAPTRKIPTGTVPALIKLIDTRNALLGGRCFNAAGNVQNTCEESAARVFVNVIFHLIEAGDYIVASELLRTRKPDRK